MCLTNFKYRYMINIITNDLCKCFSYEVFPLNFQLLIHISSKLGVYRIRANDTLSHYAVSAPIVFLRTKQHANMHDTSSYHTYIHRNNCKKLIITTDHVFTRYACTVAIVPLPNFPNI